MSIDNSPSSTASTEHPSPHFGAAFVVECSCCDDPLTAPDRKTARKRAAWARQFGHENVRARRV